ncbi:MAG: hypothetical protein AAF430_19990 [Myxococcota bacterium]
MGCASLTPRVPLSPDDPRPASLLESWKSRAAERDALQALARFAVDAPGSGIGGEDLALRIKQRVWLARPASLRVEVLGFLGTTLAVLTTDGEEYALLQAEDRRFDSGPVYDGLLWDAARLDLTPEEAVEVMLGAPQPDADLVRGRAFAEDDRVAIELLDADGAVRRVVVFGADGLLVRLEERGRDGARPWRAHFDDYIEVAGVPFARDVSLESASDARVVVRLSDVQLNPRLEPELFQLAPPSESDARAVPPEGNRG